MTTITIAARTFLVGAEFHYLKPGDRVIVVGETIIARAEDAVQGAAFEIEDVLAILDRGPVNRLRIGDALSIDRKDDDARRRLRRMLERAARDGLAVSKKTVGSGIVWSRKM